MTQNPPDHHLLGDSSNDAVCPSPGQTRARLTAAVIVRELGLVVEQGSRACGHGGVEASPQVSSVAQHADEPPTALLEELGNVRIAGWLAPDKVRLAVLVRAIEIDSLKNTHMEMAV